jgi:predicted amidohydrolase YtcJ
MGPKETDLRIEDGRIVAVGPRLRRAAGEGELDAVGGEVLPGFHDHHVHLLALAASTRSLMVGPPQIRDAGAFAAALAAAGADGAPGDWIRAVGYHDSVAGEIDRDALDRLVPHRPVRVQHRSGALWICNSAGLEALQVEAVDHAGIERDATGRPTGRLWRMDAWVGGRIRAAGPAGLDLAGLGAAAAALGITGWTDATPERGDSDTNLLLEAAGSGALRQRLHLMLPSTADRAAESRMAEAGATAGPVKIMLDDPTLPGLDELTGVIAAAHGRQRPVAVHCVTRVQLLLTLAALDAAGAAPGDRIEHGAVIPAEALPRLARSGVTVVTQPNFVAERGDQYLAEVPRSDLPDLWRGASLRAAGVATAAGTDAPFGSLDPWLAVRAAMRRRTRSGRVLGLVEAVNPALALRWWSGHATAPARPRRLQPGEPADLVVLAAPLRAALAGDEPVPVRATLIRGEVVRPGSAG